MAYSTDWVQLILTIAATCALPALVVGYVGLLRPEWPGEKSRQEVNRNK